mmetsp:Transcript_29458/g.100162  ORF Transcript_29458/g.100162 Transcript_29458/m.100162 type:complete len:200 (-) Transcript_29458:689-1288(-)
MSSESSTRGTLFGVDRRGSGICAHHEGLRVCAQLGVRPVSTPFHRTTQYAFGKCEKLSSTSATMGRGDKRLRASRRSFSFSLFGARRSLPLTIWRSRWRPDSIEFQAAIRIVTRVLLTISELVLLIADLSTTSAVALEATSESSVEHRSWRKSRLLAANTFIDMVPRTMTAAAVASRADRGRNGNSNTVPSTTCCPVPA